MHVWNLLHAARWKHRTQNRRQKSPSAHHRTTLSGCIDNRKKNLLSSNMSTCPHNTVNIGPLAAEIDPVVWGTLQISKGFASWQRYCTTSSSGRQPNFTALNRGRHLCSAGRPSRWALAHILVMAALCNRAGHYILPCGLFLSSFFLSSPNLSGRRLDVYHTSTHIISYHIYFAQKYLVQTANTSSNWAKGALTAAYRHKNKN